MDQSTIMKVASIPFAIVVVLFAEEAGAMSQGKIEHLYTTTVAGATFGFEDGAIFPNFERQIPCDRVFFSQLEEYEAPFAAK